MSEYTRIAERARSSQLIIDELLEALEQMQTAKGCFGDCRWEYSGRHHGACIQATYAIAIARMAE